MATLKDFTKDLSNFAYRNGWDIGQFFDDFLRYVIHQFTYPVGSPMDGGWGYTKEQSKEFYQLVATFFQVLQSEIKDDGQWRDILGCVYEELIAGKGRRDSKGQFFTPESLCNLMVDITAPAIDGNHIRHKTVNDCACGSGRNLLAFHAKHPGNYMVGEDVDRTCAMMTVVNFLAHGVVGEVVWHNTITMEFYGAWKVNEGINDFMHPYYHIPHAKRLEEKETMTSKIWWNMMQKHERKNI